MTVSVVIPTRDRKEMAEAAIRSVLQQTRPVEQIVVIDDGSAPSYANYLRTLSPMIEVHDCPVSRGASAARNLGLERVRGDHVLFLDDDDLVNARFVEDGLAVLDARKDVGAVTFLSDRIVATTGAAGADRSNPVEKAFLEERPITAFLRFLIPIHSTLVRRDAIGDLRFPEDLRQGEDTVFWIRLAARGCRFAFDPRVNASVRYHEGNTTRSRARYVEEIQPCYERLLAEGLLTDRDDAYLAHLKLAWFKVLTGRPGRLHHLAQLLRRPDLALRELGFWSGNLWRRPLKRDR